MYVHSNFFRLIKVSVYPFTSIYGQNQIFVTEKDKNLQIVHKRRQKVQLSGCE